jgi:hypothetical protein
MRNTDQFKSVDAKVSFQYPLEEYAKGKERTQRETNACATEVTRGKTKEDKGQGSDRVMNPAPGIHASQ